MNMRHGFGERVCRAVEGAAMYGVCIAGESLTTKNNAWGMRYLINYTVFGNPKRKMVLGDSFKASMQIKH